jgi:Ca2+-binding EF-hand superfamily protein
LDADGEHVYSRAFKMNKKHHMDGLRQAFEAYDTDKSGNISVTEMAEVLPKLVRVQCASFGKGMTMKVHIFFHCRGLYVMQRAPD